MFPCCTFYVCVHVTAFVFIFALSLLIYSSEPQASLCGSSCYNPNEFHCCERNLTNFHWCFTPGMTVGVFDLGVRGLQLLSCYLKQHDVIMQVSGMQPCFCISRSKINNSEAFRAEWLVLSEICLLNTLCNCVNVQSAFTTNPPLRTHDLQCFVSEACRSTSTVKGQINRLGQYTLLSSSVGKLLGDKQTLNSLLCYECL